MTRPALIVLALALALACLALASIAHDVNSTCGADQACRIQEESPQ